MKRLLGILSLLVVLSLALTGCLSKEEKLNLSRTEELITLASNTIVISEVFYDTPGDDNNEEYIELYNMGSTAVDIGGWTLNDNYSTFTIPYGTTVNPGDTIIIAKNSKGFKRLFGFDPDITELSLALGNSGDKVELKNSSNIIVDSVAYENYLTGWNIYANTGKSIERNPANNDTDMANDWASDAEPTPGSVTTGSSSQGSIVISEVFYDTPGTDSLEEFIELYNTGTSGIDISGWTLTDNAGTYTIPANTIIAGSSTLIIAADSTGFNTLFGFNPDISGLSIALSNTGDKVTLKDVEGNEIDFVAWENYVSGWSIYANTGYSIERNPVSTDTDTENDWLSNVSPNPGAVDGDSSGDTGGDTGGSTPPDGNNPAPGVLKVHFIDVGQGDCILVQAPTGEVMLIDAGSYQIEIENKVLSYLSSLNLSHIDVTVATHPHSDHIGSLDAVINTYPVGKAYDSGYPYTSISYDDYMNAIETNNVPFYIARRGDSFALSSDVNVQILSPTDYIVNNTTYTNDVSVVLKVTYGNTSFIFTGDASQDVEREIINEGYNVDSDVLKVGHHGSYTSTAPEFVDAVTPTNGAVILCGEGNPYGHPHQETLDTLNSRNITIYRTDLDGAMNGDIIMTSDGNTITVQQ